jgi:two-component system phosphate regulon sensor histidine kinase PhoR
MYFQYSHAFIKGGPFADEVEGVAATAPGLEDEKYGVDFLGTRAQIDFENGEPGASLSVLLSPSNRKATPSSKWRGGHAPSIMATAHQSARSLGMAEDDTAMRALVDALEEPALIVEGLTISFANGGAKTLLGSGIEGRDIRLAIRHPDALEHILTGRAAEVDVTGIGEVGRPWRVVVRDLGRGAAFVRMIDRSSTVSAERMRIDFVANASHELRTPLSTVIGYAETLADESEVDAELRGKFIQTIRDEAGRMLRIIEDLMSLSRIQADRFVAPHETVDLADVIRTAIANSAHVRGAGGCEFVTALPEHLPPVQGDRGQLVQVFDNLLSNAARYGCDKQDSKVEITGRSTNPWVTITVTDHGPGITRQHVPRLTERFYRVDEARSRGSGGTGLGLAIVKHIVERHKGALEIRSEVGVGTNVSVRLPTARS